MQKKIAIILKISYLLVMFKVICEIYKEFNEVQNNYRLGFQNCQPCDFTNFHLFKNFDQGAVRHERIQNTLDHINDLWPIHSEGNEYKELLRKVHYTEDLSEYRFIGIFEENSNVSNANKLSDYPLLFSAVIKYIDNLTYWQHLWLKYSPWAKSQENTAKKYITLLEKFYPFFMSEGEEAYKINGTIVADKNAVATGIGPYQVEKYFLTYLFLDQNNNLCDFPGENKQLNDNPEILYNNYFDSVLKLFMMDFIHDAASSRVCTAHNGKYIVKTYNSLPGSILHYTLAESSDYYLYLKHLSNVCDDKSGMINALHPFLLKESDNCATSYYNKVFKSNDLASLNCETFNDTISSFADVNDYINLHYYI
jgi:hypothetical protein